MTPCLSHGKIEIFADQEDMTILIYFTCKVKILALLIFNKVAQSMFLAFYFRGNNTWTLPSCAASKADIIIIIIIIIILWFM